MPRWSRILALAFALAAPGAKAQSLVRDDFEGPETSLVAAGGDAQYKVEFHRRVQQIAHAGHGSERIVVRGNYGASVYFAHAVGQAVVVDELAASVWIKSQRGGMQLLAEVTLPRTLDRTGKPMTALVRGTSYTSAGTWQQLRIENFPRLLQEQMRVLRAQQQRDLDAREAYVERLLINVYGGPDVSDVWIDDLEMAGVVVRPGAAMAARDFGDHLRSTAAELRDLPLTWGAGQGVPKVELQGTVLRVGGEPFFPRVVEFRGEPLSHLQSLGFNAARVSQVPSPALLREAARAHFWLIAPPPEPRELEARSGDSSAPKIGPAYDPVLIWDFGSGLARGELEATRQWAKLVAAADPRARPMMCNADADLRGYTRHPLGLFLARRKPLGTSLGIKEYGQWLAAQSQLVWPGTPLWATIQTEPAAALAEQVALLSAAPAGPITLDEAQIRSLVRTALAAGTRGLYFESSTRLDVPDVYTQRRAAVLELVNLELALIERWPASGQFASPADSNDAHVSGAVIETDRSRLLMPIHAPPNGQLALGNSTVKPLVLRAPGVTEGDDAYELSPTGLHILSPKRVAGGTSVTLAENERDALIVFTQDPRVLANLKDRIAKTAARAAELTRIVAANRLLEVEVAEGRLNDVGRAIGATAALRASAETQLKQSDVLMEKRDYDAAYARARQALRPLREVGRLHWEQAASGSDWPLADPLVAQFATLADHYRLVQQLAAAPRGPNRLAGGNFEDFTQMQQVGWQNQQYQQSPPQVVTSVELSPAAAHSGRLGLLMRSAPVNSDSPPVVIETPPFWVTSAPVPVEAGQLVEIQGWLRIPRPITASVDGLLIIESLAGDALAQRIKVSPDWRQFTLYRAAPRAGTITITFALAGLGEISIDDVTIQVVDRAASPQQVRIAPVRGVPGS